MVLAIGPDNLDYLDRSRVVLAFEENDDFFRVCVGMLQFYFEMVHGLLSLPSSSFDFRPDRLDSVQARRGGTGHGLVTAFQLIQHREIGAGVLRRQWMPGLSRPLLSQR